MTGLFGVLDRYVLLRLASVWGLCLVAFVALFLVVDVTSRLDDFLGAAEALEAAGRSVWGTVFAYYATKSITIAGAVGPYLTLFAGIATMLSLARQNEYVPMVMSGRSVHRILVPVYAFAALTVAGLLALEEYAMPRAERENAVLERLVRKKGKTTLKRLPHLRDKLNALAAEGWDAQERRIVGVECPRFVDPDGRLPEGSFRAAALSWRKDPRNNVVGWYPTDGVLVPSGLAPDGSVLPPVRLQPDHRVSFDLSPAELDVYAAGIEPGISRAQLKVYIEKHPQQHELVVNLLSRVTRPFSSLVLLLCGIPLVAGPVRKSIAAGLGAALAASVAYFLVEFLFREVASRGAINPYVAMWVPVVLFLALAAALFDAVVT